MTGFATKRHWGIGALTALIVLCAALSAQATVMKYLELAELVQISDVIVVGTVAKKIVSEDKNGQLVTDVTVSSSQTLMGGDQKSFTFQQWGGETAEKRSAIPGDARFVVGEEVVVFLRRADQAPGLFLSALGQSKFQIKRTDTSVIATREIHDISFLRDGDGPTQIEHKPDESGNFEYLLIELESLIAAKKGGLK